MLKKERKRRKNRIKKKVRGTKERPRLSVFRSTKYIYGQLIDDEKGKTLVQVKGGDSEVVGKELAEKASKKKIKSAVFDRSGYRYHGRVKQFCEAVRKGGLKI